MEQKNFITALLASDDVACEIRKEMDRLLLAIPEIGAMIGFAHCHPHHHLDVWEHTLLALSHSQNHAITRLALLLHDIGKPFCYQQDGEYRHYRGHAEGSASLAEAILLRLGFEARLIGRVAEIVRRHDTPLGEADVIADPALSSEIFEVQRCDALAHNPAYNQKRMAYIEDMRAVIHKGGEESV